MADDELVTLFARSVADFTELVRAVDDAQWTAPTPCPDWNVHALVNHVVNERLWIPPLFAGQTDRPGRRPVRRRPAAGRRGRGGGPRRG